MIIKRLYSLLLPVCFMVLIAACNDDDEIKDNNTPSLTLNALKKVDFEAREVLTIAGAVSDDNLLDKVTLQVVGPDGSEIAELNQQETFTTNNGSFSFHQIFPTIAFPGTYLANVTVLDVAGNKAEESLSVRLLAPDTSKPAVSFTGPTVKEYKQGDALHFSVETHDDRMVDSLRLFILTPEKEEAYRMKVLVDTTDITKIFNYTFSTGAMPGIYTVYATAIDRAGNDSTATMEITLLEPDTSSPEISFTGPAEQSFEGGSTVAFTGRVVDNQETDKLSFSLRDPAGSELMHEIFEVDAAAGDFSFIYNFSAEATPGWYIASIEAIDQEGNIATASVEIEITKPALHIGFSISSLPENSPANDNLYISGEFAEGVWVEPGTDERFRLTHNANGSYSIELEAAASTATDGILEYKFFRQGGWSTGELSSNCQHIANRSVATDGSTTDVRSIAIAAWEDLCQEPDNTAPALAFTAPAETSFQAGEQVTFSGTVSDNQQVDFVRLRILNPEGTEIHANTQQIDGVSGDFSFAYTFPADGAYGTYTAIATAHDPAGNTYSQSLSLTVSQAGLIGFTVANLPADTPPGEALYISGEFAHGSWVQPGSDERFRLTDNGNGTYSIRLNPATTTGMEGIVQYKFARQGGWNTVEVTAGCAPIDNRTTATDGRVTEVGDIAIGAWNDICQPEAGPSITFTVTGIPADTPVEEGLYISGEFADGLWAEPGTNENFRLTGKGDGTYSITLSVSAGTYEAGVARYKFFRQGGWATTEGAAECVHIEDRKIASDGSVTEVNAIQIINWMDLCQ